MTAITDTATTTTTTAKAGAHTARAGIAVVQILALVATTALVLIATLIGGRDYITAVNASPTVSHQTDAVIPAVDQRETTDRGRRA